MKYVRPPFFLRWLSPKYLHCDIPTHEKVIYLTFDDGPIPEVTPAVLKVLAAHEAKATFFMVGDNVRKHPEVYRQVVGEGHAVGNHTFHHLNGWKTPPGAYAENVFRCGELFETKLFRPPYGRFTPSQYMLLRKDFRFVLWSVLTYDFHRGVSPDECFRLAAAPTKPGSVVVFHDSLKAEEKVLAVLPRYLNHFRQEGYRFDSIRPGEHLPFQ